MTSEVWVPIKGTDYNYLISDHGNVFSVRRKKMLKKTFSPYNYHVVSIVIDNKMLGNRKKLVHRLVAEHFIEKTDGKEQINHIDCNKINNHYLNLEWCTPKENIHHAIENNIFALVKNKYDHRGEKSGKAKLCDKQILEIRKLYSDGMNGVKISKLYKIGRTTVYHIINKDTWTHI